MKINSHILKHFTEINRLSAFRLYVYIKDSLSGHVTKNDFNRIQEDLGLSSKTIYANINIIRSQGLIRKIKSGYWSTITWKKNFNTKYNKITDCNLDELKDLKYLRSLNYCNYYKSAYKMSKRNKNKSNHAKVKRVRDYEEVSATFAKAVTSVRVTTQTLSKHLIRAKKFGLVKIKKSWKILFKSNNINDVLLALDYNYNCHIKKYKGVYYLVRYNTNKISF